MAQHGIWCRVDGLQKIAMQARFSLYAAVVNCYVQLTNRGAHPLQLQGPIKL